uniref:Uncharacterized protein n=1 Tax=Tetranychus urticae TaxID=32264 RepID=T1KMY9_TETUR
MDPLFRGLTIYVIIILIRINLERKGKSKYLNCSRIFPSVDLIV